jgi:replicative DNA helicase
MNDQELDSRTMPHSLDAERAILGAVVLTGDAMDLIAPKIRTEDFYRAPHQQIFRAMRGLHADQIAIDFLTLKERLITAGKLDDAGGPAYIAALTDGLPRSVNVEHYVQIVKEKATRRALIVAARKTIGEAFDSDDPTADLLNAAQATLFRIAEQQTGGDGFVDMKVLMGEVLEALDARSKAGAAIVGVPSGFVDLDRQTGGFQPGDLVLIAARPSMGKTSFAQAIALHAAMKAGIPVALFSVEMSRLALGLRLVAGEARIDTLRLRDGRIYDSEWGAVSQAIGCLGESALYIDDSADLTIFDVRAKVRRLRAERGVGLIVVDYLQLMRAAEKAENKNLEVAAISRGLKVIARDLGVPVIVLSQLSRDCERRSDKRPMLSDLRDSGALEQDADVVLMLHREEYYAPKDDNRGVADVIIAKQRNGPTGTVRLTWREELTRFENAEHRRQDPRASRMPYPEDRS